MEPLAADRDRTRLLAEEMSSLAYEALAPEDVEQVKASPIGPRRRRLAWLGHALVPGTGQLGSDARQRQWQR